MGFFTGIEGKTPSRGGVYFTANKGPGHTLQDPEWLPALYVVRVKAIKTFVSRRDEKMFVLEAEILKSDNPERKPGMVVSWLVNLSRQEAGLGNIKGCIAAINGIDPGNERLVLQEVTEPVCDFAASEDQPLTGKVVGLECIMIKKRDGGDFTLHRWSPVDQGTYAAA